MNTIRFVAGLLLVVGLLTGFAASQDNQPDPAKMMELWKKYSTTGEHHKRLEYFLGKWDTVMEVKMDPNAPPMKSNGTAEFEWLAAGRWMSQKFKGTMMGMPSEGFGIMGYDNFKQKYVNVWVDSNGTQMLTSEGVVCDPEGKNIVLYGNMDEFLTGENDKAVRYATKILDDDTFEFSIWDLGIGPEGAVVIKITYTRQKAD